MIDLTTKATRSRAVILASDPSFIPRQCENLTEDSRAYAALLTRIRTFREAIWRADGAILPSGRDPHFSQFAAFDETACHIALLDEQDELVGCARLLNWNLRSTAFQLEHLALHPLLARMTPPHNRLFTATIGQFLDDSLARQAARVGYLMEMGGWAVKQQPECFYAAPQLVALGWALGTSIGVIVGLAAATVRHRSNGILKRLGMFALEYEGKNLPVFYDPYYRCDMEIVGSYPSHPGPRIEAVIADFTQHFARMEVLVRDPSDPAQRNLQTNQHAREGKWNG